MGRGAQHLSRYLPASPSTGSYHRAFVSTPSSLSPSRLDPHRKYATTTTSNTDWLAWLRKASALNIGGGKGEDGNRRALLFAGLGSYPHTPYSPTRASLEVWERASEALLSPDATIGYFPARMEEFAGAMRGAMGGSIGMRGWLRGWVEGRSLDELMKRPDVTAAFILTSSVAILASAQEVIGSPSLLPPGTTHLAGHGFIGTLSALVAGARLDLPTGVRLATIYTSLPSSPSSSPPRYLTTVLSARHFHSLSSPPWESPFMMPSTNGESSSAPEQRKRAMQLILDEIHGLEKQWEVDQKEWAGANIINSSKVLGVTGTQNGVLQLIDRLQYLSLANPVMDVHMPCPYGTPLMQHTVPKFRDVIQRCFFRDPLECDRSNQMGPQLTILDPITTHPIGQAGMSLVPHLTEQMRWHKTLSRLYKPVAPPVDAFLTVGRGAKGLGVMLKGELRNRPKGAPEIAIEEFGVVKSTGARPKVAL